MLTVYDFNDYRKFLKYYYDDCKKLYPGFSYRSFAKKAQLKSANYLKLIIDRKRNLTEYYLDNFVSALKLKPDETSYFIQLVKMNNCKDPVRKGTLLKDLISTLIEKKVKTASSGEMKILQKWYIWVIREMINLKDFSDDPQYLAKRLFNLITPTQAAQALNILIEEGLVLKEGDQYKLVDQYYSTKDEVLSLAIVHLMGEMLELSRNALHHFDFKQREISGLTISINQEDFEKVKEEIKQFRRQINLKYSSSQADDVYQMNIQFFPLTRKIVG